MKHNAFLVFCLLSTVLVTAQTPTQPPTPPAGPVVPKPVDVPLAENIAAIADVSGVWIAAIDTQIGVQNYTYTFKLDGGKLTGRTKSQFGESEISDGKVSGEDITFVENLNYEGMPLRIVYKGKISRDEIKFTRNVAELADETFVARRTK